MKLICIAILVMIMSINIASAESVSLDNWTFDLKNGAFISIPYLFNATNFTNTITGELSFWLNNSFIAWRTGTNKSITNILVNNDTDVFSFNGNGTDGYLNITGLMKNATANYSLFVDGTRYAYAVSNSSKYVTFNYTGSWSDHVFIVNYTLNATSANATTDNFHIYLDGIFKVNTTNPYYNATGLTPNTEYTINIKSHNNTYDTFGTWVNQSITTSEAPATPDTNTTPAVSSVTNQTCLTNNCVISFNVNQTNAITRTRYGTTAALTLSKANQTTGAARTDSLSSLLSNTLYYYSVDAWNASNQSYYTNSTIQNFTTAIEVTVGGAPIITGYSSTYAGTATYTSIPSGQLNTYTVTSYIGNITGYTWSLDGVNETETSASYASTLSHRSTGGNLRYIRVYGTGVNGSSNTIEWRVSVMRSLAVLPLVKINQTAYNDSKNAISALNLESFMTATMSGYTNVLSDYVYLFIWGIIFAMIWIRQRSITIPSTIGLILGGIIIATLPEQYQFIAQFIIAMGGFALIYVMFGERQ